MGLGFLTLSIKSEEDKYLTGNPQFTFFKAVYKKHTNFATDFQFVNLIGDSNNTLGKKVYLDIPKNGDLLHRTYIVADVSGNDLLENVSPLAYSLIDYVDLFIGGDRIDRHYGHWLQIWHEMNEPSEKQNSLANMVNMQSSGTSTNKLYIPLRFWFNNNVGMALPLLALQYNDIKIEIQFKNASDVNTYSECIGVAPLKDPNFNITNVQVLCEFIHLDTEERKLFSSNSHEYLITQVQSSLHNPVNLHSNSSDKSFSKIQHKCDLRFNHPVREIIWTFQDSNGFILNNNSEVKNFYNKGILNYNYWNGFRPNNDHMEGAQLVLNGKDISEELPGSFYRNLQKYQYHSGCNLKFIKDKNISLEKPSPQYTDYSRGTGIYSYSFCLSPEDYQPSGSLNFSNLEIAQLKYRLKRNKFKTFTVDYATTLPLDAADVNGIINNVTVIDSYTAAHTESVDDVELPNNSIILVKNQINQTENGIYKLIKDSEVPGPSKLVRHEDFNDNTVFINNNPYIIKISNRQGSTITEEGNSFSMVYTGVGAIGEVGSNIICNKFDESVFSLRNKTLTIYAVNYNIFRIMSGMGSVLFSS